MPVDHVVMIVWVATPQQPAWLVTTPSSKQKESFQAKVVVNVPLSNIMMIQGHRILSVISVIRVVLRVMGPGKMIAWLVGLAKRGLHWDSASVEMGLSWMLRKIAFVLGLKCSIHKISVLTQQQVHAQQTRSNNSSMWQNVVFVGQEQFQFWTNVFYVHQIQLSVNKHYHVNVTNHWLCWMEHVEAVHKTKFTHLKIRCVFVWEEHSNLIQVHVYVVVPKWLSLTIFANVFTITIQIPMGNAKDALELVMDLDAIVIWGDFCFAFTYFQFLSIFMRFLCEFWLFSI